MSKVLMKKTAEKKLTLKKPSQEDKTSSAKKNIHTRTRTRTQSSKITSGIARKSAQAKSSGKKDVTPATYSEADAGKKVQGITYAKLSEITGYAYESDKFVVAVEILKGAATKQEINQRAKELLPMSSRTATPKAVSNLVSMVIGKLLTSGFTIKGEWKMIVPTD